MIKEEPSSPRIASAVFRLRATFAIVLGLFLIALVLGAWQLSRLERSQAIAVERSVPALVSSQVLARQLSTFLRRNDELRLADTATETTTLHEAVRAISSSMHATLDQLPREASFESTIERIDQDLSAIEDQTDALKSLKLDMLDSEVAFAEHRKALETIGTVTRELLEPQLIEVGSTLATTLGGAGVALADTNSSMEILRLVERQDALTIIAVRLGSVVDEATQLARPLDKEFLEASADRLRFNFRNIVSMIPTLDAGALREELSRQTRDLWEHVAGTGGLVELQEAHVGLERRFEDIQSSQASVIANVSTRIGAIVESTRKDVSTTAVTFDRVLFQTFVLFMLVGLSIVTVVALASWHIVERQINRRMSRLTDAVLQTAAGGTGISVQIDGRDEISAMSRALETFQENALALRRSNNDLEQFAYAAAHDMRTPLNAIKHLAEWTLEDNADLGADCQANLHKIMQRATRLATLQNDLLKYSHAGHGEDSYVATDPEALIRDQAELTDTDQRLVLTIEGDLQPMMTYAVPLGQVLLNLMSNAVKYHDKETGRLHVDLQQGDGRMTVTVQDDGPGIPVEYQKQIFELFKRLKSQDAVEGSGLGLSMVRKLVGRYGGSIDVHSEPERHRGTTFTFDWPCSPQP